MSLNYINPKTQQTKIKNTLSIVYELFDQLGNNEGFFIIMNKLGCLINVFYRRSTFSTTDCCTTVESLWKLFDPKNKKNEKFIIISQSQELIELLNNENYNIYNFRLIGDLVFHNFLVLRYDNNWYLLNSYVNICEMNIINNNDILSYLNDILITGSISSYNTLFKTNLITNNKINKVYYDVDAAFFDKLPIEKLKILISSFIKLDNK